MSIFCLSILSRTKYVKKKRRFFAHRNYVEGHKSKRRHFFCPYKLRRSKYVKKTPLFLPIQITLKKCVKITCKFVDIFSSMYQCNIAIESTLIRRGVSVGKCKLSRRAVQIKEQVFLKIGILEKLVNYAGKHLCWKLF